MTSAFPYNGFYIFEDGVEAGNKDKGDEGGEQDAEGEADGHGDEEASLEALFEYHGAQSEKGGQGGHDDRTEAAGSGTADYLFDRFIRGSAAIDQIDQDQGVVNYHAGKGDDTKHGK